MSSSSDSRTGVDSLDSRDKILFDPDHPGMITTDLSAHLEMYHFGEASMGRSIPTRCMFSVTVPDPINPTAEFFYNYFVPTERAEIHPDSKSILFNSADFSYDDIEYIARTDQIPRYVKLKFSPPNFSQNVSVGDVTFYAKDGSALGFEKPEDFDALTSEDTISIDLASEFISSFDSAVGDLSLDQIIAKITVEGASSNPNFSGVEIIDTFADKKIYTMLSSSMVFQNIGVTANSPRERAQLFRDKISGNSDIPNPLGPEKTELIDVITELQPAGVSLAPGDVPEEDAELARDPITKQSFSVKFNNLFFGDIIEYAALNANTIYEDEIRGLIDIASQTQTDLIESIDPSLTYEHDYQMKVKPVKITTLEITQEDVDKVIEQSEALIEEFKEVLGVSEEADNMWMFYDYLEGVQQGTVEGGILNSAIAGLYDPVGTLISRLGLPKIKIIGYLIQKTEILKGGTTKDFPDIFVDNPKTFTEFIDKNVRYGAVYNYKARSLAIATAVIKVVNKADGSSKYAIADFLIASDGTNIAVDCVENIPPPPPTRIKARVDYKYRSPLLTWEFPFNKQRDIKRFQVFKRANIDEPFTLVAEYDFDDSIDRTVPNETAQSDKLYSFSTPYRRYRDSNFNLYYDTAIYTVACVDAHGLSSNYGKQISVKYDKYTNRLITNVISNEGAPKPYPNLYLREDFFEDIIRSSARDRCTIFFDPEYYSVFRPVYDSDGTMIKQESVPYINTSDENYNYSFQFINVDLQQEQTVNVRIVDRAGSEVDIPAASISPTNLSFEFGV